MKWLPQQPVTVKGDPASRAFLEYLNGLGGGSTSIAWGGVTGTLSDQTDLQSALDAKQDDLVSGTNIKTVNGNSLLGSGDVAVATETYFGILASNYTLAASTAVQKLFNWSANGALTLATGIYHYRCLFYLLSMSGTSGNGRFDILGAGTATLARVLQSSYGRDIANPVGAPGALGGAMINGNIFATNTVTAGTAVGMHATTEGVFDVTATGTIIPSIALTTAASAVVQAGSLFWCQRIGDTGDVTAGTWS